MIKQRGKEGLTSFSTAQAQGRSGKGELQIQLQSIANNNKMSGASEELKRRVLAKMPSSNISRIVKSDGAILLLGNVWLKKVGGQRNSVVSSKMLSWSRMVDELRKLCPNEGEFMIGFLKPNFVDAILGSCQQPLVDRILQKQVIPHTNILQQYSSWAMIWRNLAPSRCAGTENRWSKRAKLAWARTACNDVLHSTDDTEREKVQQRSKSPQTTDLMKLTEHVSQQLKLAMEEIVENVSNRNYKRLQMLCLVRLLLFNKRRPGELSQLSIQK